MVSFGFFMRRAYLASNDMYANPSAYVALVTPLIEMASTLEFKNEGPAMERIGRTSPTWFDFSFLWLTVLSEFAFLNATSEMLRAQITFKSMASDITVCYWANLALSTEIRLDVLAHPKRGGAARVFLETAQPWPEPFNIALTGYWENDALMRRPIPSSVFPALADLNSLGKRAAVANKMDLVRRFLNDTPEDRMIPSAWSFVRDPETRERILIAISRIGNLCRELDAVAGRGVAIETKTILETWHKITPVCVHCGRLSRAVSQVLPVESLGDLVSEKYLVINN